MGRHRELTTAQTTAWAAIALLWIAPLTAQSGGSTPTSAAGPLGPSALLLQEAPLAGRSITSFPHFRHVDGFHAGSVIEIALDTAQFPELIGRTCRVFVVRDKSRARWADDPGLVDARGAVQLVTWSSDIMSANAVVIDSGQLSGSAGDRLGRGYDVVLDFDHDRRLSRGDVIDGADGAGLWVVTDTTLAGPHAVDEVLYSGGAYLGQDTYFPSDIATLGSLPLIVISHGNGHDYRWYDHLGLHLASWGAVVMSHQNETGPGPDTASLTTLANTDYLLANLDRLAGGVLAGHVDAQRIVWIGHSRGGEGAVRAYRRLKNGEYSSPRFDWRDIVLVSAIAPTTQLAPTLADPGVVAFALLYGGADTDVSSAPFLTNSKPLTYFERAQGDKHLLYVQGAGHADFHAGGGPCWCAGPNLIGAPATHVLMRGYYRALVELYAFERPAAREFFARGYTDFRPPGIDAGVVVASEYRDARALGAFVVDDFEAEPAFDRSSSGAAVVYDALDFFEGELLDFDGSFVWSSATPMNGMLCGRRDESPHGIVFEWEPTQPRFVEFLITAAHDDVQAFEALSLRAAQGTRHPQTDTLDGPLSFSVTLRDRYGTSSTISTARYGSVTRTYPRQGVGAGAGWINEFCTLRIPLRDFASNGNGLDLSQIRAVRLDFGPSFGSPRGRLGLDDVEFVPRRDS